MQSETVRPAALGGTFYPATAATLTRAIAAAFADAAPAGPPTRYLIAPHAGYQYSGAVAASAYRRIATGVRRVLILGPAHRVAVGGMALPTAAAFATPLGEVMIDRHACDRLAQHPAVRYQDDAHRDEHCIEVHLPFLQVALETFTLVPVLVGDASATDVAAVIADCDDPATLVLVSSDLSHFHAYATANALDTQTTTRILALDGGLAGTDACGAAAINGLLAYARTHALGVELLDRRNSGDTAGNRERVVGYGSFALRRMT